MPHISATKDILPNPYFKSLSGSFDNVLDQYIHCTTNVKYIVLEPIYNSIDLTANNFDPLDFFSDQLITRLQAKTMRVIFDCSIEGSHVVFPYYNYFRNSFETRNIDFSIFFYLTGSPVEKEISVSKNIYCINLLDYLVKENYKKAGSASGALRYLFSCLNRKPRYWRSKMIYLLSLEPHLTNKFLFSHSTVSKDNFFLDHNVIDEEMLNFFLNKNFDQVTDDAPLTDNMPFRHVISTLPEVYKQVVFDVAMETYQEGPHEYITEKTFKPMVNLVPVLIWGTPGINTRALERFGFKTYHDWFDLSFDLEPDTEKRLTMLIGEIKRVCAYLQNCTVQEQLDWQQKNKHILEYNKQLILNLLPSNKQEFTRLLVDLENS